MDRKKLTFPNITWDQAGKFVFMFTATTLAIWSIFFKKSPKPNFYIEGHKDKENLNQTIKNSNNANTGSSTSSWLVKDTKKWGTKFDLMHTGNRKGGKLVIVMVGIPNRGKTYIARKVARYLRWISYRARVFSLAKNRLEKVGIKSATYFDPNDTSSTKERHELMLGVLEDSIRYLSGGGEIAILDGTNCTKARRQAVKDRIAKEDGYELLWIESIRDSNEDRDVNNKNVAVFLRDSPDYMDREDFLRKLAHYESIYEPLSEEEGGSYVKIYGSGENLFLHEIFGFLRTKIASFVMNLHTMPRPVYMTRHGESVFNVRGLIGGDSGLSHRGVQFAEALGVYISKNEDLPPDKLCVWTSTMRRCKETISTVKCKRLVEWRALREIEVGVCDGMSYEQVKTQFPEEFRARDLDKLRYRYPRGESYMDIIYRLEPIIFELERQTDPVVIVAHQAVLRCLYAYFFDLPVEEIPYLSVPLHTVIRLEPRAIGCNEKRLRIVVEDDKLHSNGKRNLADTGTLIGKSGGSGVGEASAPITSVK